MSRTRNSSRRKQSDPIPSINSRRQLVGKIEVSVQESQDLERLSKFKLFEMIEMMAVGEKSCLVYSFELYEYSPVKRQRIMNQPRFTKEAYNAIRKGNTSKAKKLINKENVNETCWVSTFV